jgi:hypothetical protein
MIRPVEECVNLCDGHPLVHLTYLDDFVSRAYFTFLQNAEVESWSSARCQQRGHARLVHPNAHAIAGNARLRNLKERAADAITITDAHGVVRQPLNSKVLPELSVGEVGPIQHLLPISIRFDLVNEDGPLFAAMSCRISLAISVQI